MNKITKDTWYSLEKMNGISVVKVYANWCAPCRFLATHMNKWEKEFSSPEVHFFEFEKDAAKDFATHELKVEALPTILFIKRGQEVGRIRGITNRQKFLEALDKAVVS